MGDLFEWLANADDNLLVRSCVFHYEFEFIHPFMDGNGRTGRLWQSLILGKLNPVFSHLPVENIVYANQQDYYDAIAVSTAKGDSGPFIELMLGEIARTLKGTKATNKVTNKSDIKALEIIAVNPNIIIKGLMEGLNLSESGVKKILLRLTASGLIMREGSRKKGSWLLLFDINDLK